MQAIAIFENLTGIPVPAEQVLSGSRGEGADEFRALVDRTAEPVRPETADSEADTPEDAAAFPLAPVMPQVRLPEGPEPEDRAGQASVQVGPTLVEGVAGQEEATPEVSAGAPRAADSLPTSGVVKDAMAALTPATAAGPDVMVNASTGAADTGEIIPAAEVSKADPGRPEAVSERPTDAPSVTTPTSDAVPEQLVMAAAKAMPRPTEANSMGEEGNDVVAEEADVVAVDGKAAAEAEARASGGGTSDETPQDGFADEVSEQTAKRDETGAHRNGGVFALYEAATAATVRTSGGGNVVSDPAAIVRTVSSELGQAVVQQPDGTVEVTLSQDELGHVKVSMRHEDGAMSITVQADRQETIDLLKRHVDVLARDMRELGFTDVGFSFDDRGGGQKAQTAFLTTETSGDESPAMANAVFNPVAQSRSGGMNGLDLRM